MHRMEEVCSVETCENRICRTDLICQRAWEEVCKRDSLKSADVMKALSEPFEVHIEPQGDQA